MNDIWKDIGAEIPYYMKKICEKYNMRCEKLSDYDTVIYNNNCCLIIQIGRFDIGLLYVFKEKEKVYAYECGIFFAMRFNNEDMKGVIKEEKAGDSVKNYLQIFANGLISKCEDVLSGNKDWIGKYKQSSRYSETILSPQVVKALEEKQCFSMIKKNQK